VDGSGALCGSPEANVINILQPVHVNMQSIARASYESYGRMLQAPNASSISPGANVKNFFDRDLRIFVLSWSVCWIRLEKLYKGQTL
jgi:hypothetical protein